MGTFVGIRAQKPAPGGADARPKADKAPSKATRSAGGASRAQKASGKA